MAASNSGRASASEEFGGDSCASATEGEDGGDSAAASKNIYKRFVCVYLPPFACVCFLCMRSEMCLCECNAAASFKKPLNFCFRIFATLCVCLFVSLHMLGDVSVRV